MDSRREELKAFLRARRAAVTPDAAGLKIAARRRTPGLRREEVALPGFILFILPPANEQAVRVMARLAQGRRGAGRSVPNGRRR